MTDQLESLKPVEGANRAIRRRLPMRAELTLALLPTAMVLVVLGFVEALSHQRLLFASLASSAFLIYLDPQHGTNSVRTLTVSHLVAALLGWGLFLALGPGYLSAGSAMVATIFLMIMLDVVHPPAVSTAMSFALRAGDAANLLLFGLSLAIIAVLVVLERSAVWMLARHHRREAAASA
jgi:CBS-domain-containing membrane protein